MESSIAALSRHQISDFFAKTCLTQQQCDEQAELIAGTPVHAAIVQGGTSYTVVNEQIAVQFRAKDFMLDIEFLGHVERAYANFMPHHRCAGKLGDLYIYTMNNVGGISMYLARNELLQNDCQLLQRTLQDYARFFASAWHNTPASMLLPKRETLLEDYSSQLRKLYDGLPMRFRSTLDHLITRLPDLFAEDWPLVPNHIDLLENNIHVDRSTGQIMGICDWKDAEISPFGMSLGGLETMLGIWKMKEGWCYHTNQQTLRAHFWEAFYNSMGDISETQKELVNLARLVGIFLANGFELDDNENKVPASSLQYLEAVVLGN
ncbi:hypothetical protein TRIATDRAFT_87271 [Trichoderma atroviride IMI 206040]|uniref:Aminoglycoside phosphotransferase domain-containing protein n=1 Tax=Hypocrea atroviridis (strain ATCC 20476 / IMI 206040) TaxID=452589 RepID=G9NXM4_HYPAI|nr:uncharacterized protein TRIATDRAFT_87271 [Trichoderma atroviride IMI 206040]EHK44204.1 hypothetical protein TRIATDRAFT_87271 [Trichoderma atroviride IMI 206040]